MSYENGNEEAALNNNVTETSTKSKCGINEFVNDESFSPNSDFFNYVNNKWIQENPIPDEYVRWGGFEILHEKNQKNLHKLITDFDITTCDANDKFANIVRLYQKGMDTKTIESEGILSLSNYFKNIFSVQSSSDFFNLLGQFSMKGICGFFGMDVDADAKNSSQNVIYLCQSGLGMPDRDYYFLENKSEEREKYKEYLVKIFENFEMGDVQEITSKVYEIEEQLAKVSQTRTERRDPHLTYNEVTFKKLCEDYPNIDWIAYINNTFLCDHSEWTSLNETKFVIDNPKFFEEVNSMLEKYNFIELQWYMMNRTIYSLGNYLNDKTYEIIFDYYGRKLLGQKEPKPRWKRMMSLVQILLGELLGKKYVENYFPEDSKKKMLQLVDDLKDSLQNKLENLTWMTEETKEKALLKLKHFGVKIGYPDKWRNYSELDCKEEYNFVETIVHCREFNTRWELSDLGKPVDRTKWEMNPQEINAYYHPVMNEIVFPAGILQAPFFDPEQHDAYNYGAIGAIIGHEMTHGFDDQGRKFDHEGNMVNWWTDEDVKEYTARTDVIKEQYGNYEIEGEKLNGELTLGENIADIGGLIIANDAYVKRYELDGISRDNFSKYTETEIKNMRQKLFYAWARAWRTHMRSEAQLQRILTDPHSPAIFRVNGVVKNVAAYYDVFNINTDNDMYLTPEDRANIW